MAFSGNLPQVKAKVIPDISFDPLVLLRHLKDHKIISFSDQDQTLLFGSTSNSNSGLPISPHAYDSLYGTIQLSQTINQFEKIIQNMKIEDYGAFLKFTSNLFAPQQEANLDYKQLISNFFILKILEKLQDKVLFNLSAEDASYLANLQQTVASLAKQDAQLLTTTNSLPNIYELAKETSQTKIPAPLDLQTLMSLPPNSVVEINPYALNERYFLEANIIKSLMGWNVQEWPLQLFIPHNGSIPNTIKAGVEYPFSLGDQNNPITIKIKFTNSMALYINSANSFRYTILEDTLGKGTYGEAVHATKALALNNNGTLRTKKSHYDYVTKIIKNHYVGDPNATQEEKEKINAKFVESIMHEHLLGRKLSHLHTKAKPVFIYDDKGYISECHITMRKLKGVSINEHLHKRGITSHKPYNKKTKEYTKEDIDTLLDQSINLMRALKKVHNVGIIHRDIKPDNIIIDPITNKFYIFDLGLSKEKGTVRHETSATPINLTPEQIIEIEQPRQANFRSQNITNESTDYWELALTLAQLWGMGHIFGHHKHKDTLYRDVLNGANYQEAHMVHLVELYDVDDHPEQLLYIINNLLHDDPLVRAETWQDAQKMLETMRLDRSTPGSRPAHALALKLRHELDDIEIKKGGSSALFKVLEEIKQACLTSDILDDPAALKEFNRVLGIKQLSKFTNKTDFQNHLDSMLEMLKLAEKIPTMMIELAASPIHLQTGGKSEQIFQQLFQANLKLLKTDATPGKIIQITEKLNYPFLSQFYDVHVLHREITAINPYTHPTFHAYLTELLETNLKKILISMPMADLRTATELPVIRDYILNHNDLFQTTFELQAIHVNLLLATHEELSAKLGLQLSIPDRLLKDTDFLRELCKHEIEIQSRQPANTNVQPALIERIERLESELQRFINKHQEKAEKGENCKVSNISSSLFAKQSATSSKNESITPEANNPPTLGNSSGGSTL